MPVCMLVRDGPQGEAWAVVVAEQHALGGQRVEMRRLHAGMLERRQAFAAPLVGRNEQNLANLVGGHVSPV